MTQKPKHKHKAAVYCRVSTQDQNLDTQVDGCVEWCENNYYEPIIFIVNTSGAKASWPYLV